MGISLNPLNLILGKNKWDPRNLPDLTGRVYVVTGANRGMGFENVKHLFFKNAKVYLGARDEARGLAAVQKLKELRDEANKRSPNSVGHLGEVIWLPVHFSEAKSAKAAAERLLELETRLDVIVNNAAVLPDFSRPPEKKGQVQDFMILHHIAPFVFVQTLLPLLLKTASLPDADVRIVMISSFSHRMKAGMNPKLQFRPEDLCTTFAEEKYPQFAQYSFTKLANVLYTYSLRAKLSEFTSDAPSLDEEAAKLKQGAKNITVISVHPGFVDTFSKDDRLPLQPLSGYLVRKMTTQPDEGACTATFAAAASEVAPLDSPYRGAYLLRGPKIVSEKVLAENPNVAPGKRETLCAQLWDSTEKYLEEVGVVVPDPFQMPS